MEKAHGSHKLPSSAKCDIETTPRGSKSCFQDRHTEAIWQLTGCDSQPPCQHSRRQVWELVQHLPRAETPCTPTACPGAGGLQVCPGNPLLRVQEVLYRSSFSTGP